MGSRYHLFARLIGMVGRLILLFVLSVGALATAPVRAAAPEDGPPLDELVLDVRYVDQVYVQQHVENGYWNHCGPASAAMILHYEGIETRDVLYDRQATLDLVQRVKPSGVGASDGRLIRQVFAEEGLDAWMDWTPTFAEIRDSILRGQPVLMSIADADHILVVTGVKGDGTIVVNDPFGGRFWWRDGTQRNDEPWGAFDTPRTKGYGVEYAFTELRPSYMIVLGGEGPRRAICPIADSFQVEHTIVTDRYGNQQTVSGRELHAGDTFWVKGLVQNPGGSAREATVTLTITVNGQTFTKSQVVTVPAASTAEVRFLADAPPVAAAPQTIDIVITTTTCNTPATLRVPVSPRPVVLIHGYTGSAGGMDGLAQLLRERGYEPHAVDTLSLGDKANPKAPTRSLSENARALRDYINGVRLQTGASMVDLIGHSMGGLVAREYIHSYMPTVPRAVGQLIMLGTPNAGSPLAWADVLWGNHRPSSSELVPDYFNSFNSLITERYGVPFHLVAGDGDRDNPALPGDDDCVVQVSSARAVPPDDERLVVRSYSWPGNTCWPGESLHTLLVHDRAIFEGQILPFLESPVAVGAQAAQAGAPDVSLAGQASAASMATPAETDAVTPAMIELARLVATADAPIAHRIVLGGQTDVAFQIFTDDLAARAWLIAPDGRRVDLEFIGGTPGSWLPTFSYTDSAPPAGAWVLHLEPSAERAEVVLMVMGVAAVSSVAMTIEHPGASDRIATPISVTISGTGELTQAQIAMTLITPNGEQRTVPLAREGADEGTDLRFSGTIALEIPGIYNLVLRVTGEHDSQPFQEIATSLITSQIDPSTRCYAVADNDGIAGSPDALVALDRLTGEAALIAPLGTRTVHAMTTNPVDGSIYVVVRDRLGRLNPQTGAVQLMPEHLGRGNGANGWRRFNDIDGLSYSATEQLLYAVQRLEGQPTDLLFKIDPASGRAVRGAFGPGIDYVRIGTGRGRLKIDDLAFSPHDGQLYALAHRNSKTGWLLQIDPVTGVVSEPIRTGVKQLRSLAFTSTGELYAITGRPVVGNDLYQIDPTTGVPTLVGPLVTQQDFEALTCSGV